MQAGQIDRRITIQRATVAQDATGQEVSSWSNLATVWAGKQDVSDTERIASAEVQATITTRFQIRWSSAVADVNPKDRLIYAGKTYDISAVKEICRREGLELSAAARAD